MYYGRSLLASMVLISSGLLIASADLDEKVAKNRHELMHILRWESENSATVARVAELVRDGIGNIDERETGDQVTALELAVIRIAPEWCRLLLQAGAGINVPGSHITVGHLLTNYQESPFLAGNRSRFDQGCAVMNLLIQYHYDINSLDNAGETPLHELYSSCLQGGMTEEAAEYFLRHGADITIPSRCRNNLRLIDCAPKNSPMGRAIRKIAQENLIRSINLDDTVGIKNALLRGASVGMQDRNGNNVFHIAAMRIGNHASMTTFTYLLSLPIHAIGHYLNVLNHDRDTPMHILVLNGNAQDILNDIAHLPMPTI